MITRPARPGDSGSASLEMAALVPIVISILILVLQLFAAAYTTQAASQAARDAARAYSLTGSAVSAHAAADASLPGAVRLVGIETFGPRHGVRVEVEAPPIQLIGDRRVTREVVMP